MQSPSAWLEFPSGERRPIIGMCSIGRSPENRIVIPSEGVSRRHAVIRESDDGSHTLIDFGSSNGTYLNGQRASRPVPLRDGWVIEVGMQKMTFRTLGGAGKSIVEGGSTDARCWLLLCTAAFRGCRTPSEEQIDKTFESWSERCRRVVAKHRGRLVRALDDGILAYWQVEGADSKASTVAAAAQALRAVQQKAEEFRFALHFGTVALRASGAGEDVPAGPEVIFSMQLQRLARMVNCAVLLSDSAREQLGTEVPTRLLTQDELRGFRGEQRFHTIIEPDAAARSATPWPFAAGGV